MSESNTDSEPNLAMLPKSLRCLDWQPMKSYLEFYDGDKLLVAVPVNIGRTQEDKSWCYELSIIFLSCDSESPLAVSCNDEEWGWDLSDVEFFVRINQ